MEDSVCVCRLYIISARYPAAGYDGHAYIIPKKTIQSRPIIDDRYIISDEKVNAVWNWIHHIGNGRIY